MSRAALGVGEPSWDGPLQTAGHVAGGPVLEVRDQVEEGLGGHHLCRGDVARAHHEGLELGAGHGVAGLGARATLMSRWRSGSERRITSSAAALPVTTLRVPC